MPGKPGRTGGKNRIAPEIHLLRGTFRPERHARLLPPGPTWTPTTEQLDGLAAAGRALVDRLTADYTLNRLEGEMLMEAGQVADRLAQLRDARAGADVPLRLKLDRVEQGWLRQFASLLLALKADR